LFILTGLFDFYFFDVKVQINQNLPPRELIINRLYKKFPIFIKILDPIAI
jgi:hypothetical protein